MESTLGVVETITYTLQLGKAAVGTYERRSMVEEYVESRGKASVPPTPRIQVTEVSLRTGS